MEAAQSEQANKEEEHKAPPPTLSGHHPGQATAESPEGVGERQHSQCRASCVCNESISTGAHSQHQTANTGKARGCLPEQAQAALYVYEAMDQDEERESGLQEGVFRVYHF